MIEKIIHISDIHIRNMKRHKEYYQTITTTVEKCKQIVDGNTIIILTGDIVHSKTETSPEASALQTYLYRSLADICPLILITGNHDCNLNNRGRMDALFPVIDAMQHPNIHYWDTSGVYDFMGVKFSVMSVYDNKSSYIRAYDISDGYKIALLHDAVNNSKTEVGHSIESSMTVDFFDGFDLVLLGDIHLPNQILQSYRQTAIRKYPEIRYPGSLIQQNHGEGVGHGFLVWDLPNHTAEFIEVENEYGYYTLVVDSGEIQNLDWELEIPKKVRLRVFHRNTSPIQLQHIISEVAAHDNVSEILETSKIPVNNNTTNGEMTHDINYESLNSVEYQSELIRLYMSEGEYSPEMIEAVCKLNSELNSTLPDVSERVSRTTWTPLKLTYENMFTFGTKNEIDFTILEGIHAIFAPNAYGKSSVLDIILFCIFDQTSRTNTNRAQDVINNQSDSFFVELECMFGNAVYVIRREGKKHANGRVRVDVDFYRKPRMGETNIQNLNGEDRTGTNNKIRDFFGNYEDFTITSMALQSQDSDFISFKPKKRRDLITRFMGLNILSQLKDCAASKYRESSAELKILQRKNFGELKSQYLRQIDAISRVIDKNQSELSTVELNLGEMTERLNALRESKYIIDDVDLSSLEVRISDTEKRISKITQELDSTSKDTKEKEAQLFAIQSERSKIDVAVAKSNIDLHGQLSERMGEIISKLQSTNKLLIRAKKELAKTSEMSFDPDCDACNSNKELLKINNIQVEISELTNELATMKAEELGVNSQQIQIDVSAWQSLLYQASDLDRKIDTINNRLAMAPTYKKSLDVELYGKRELLAELQQRHEKISENVEKISHNNRTQKEIEAITKKYTVANKKHSDLYSNIESNKARLQSIKGHLLVECERGLDDIERVGSEQQILSAYLSVMREDALPNYIIESRLKILEGHVNTILSLIVDFSLEFDFSGKSIDFNIKYSDRRKWSVNLGSGMEKFISSLAIRMALARTSNIPIPNFMAIDEGFGVLDVENLNSLPQVFDYLKNHFKFVLCISHHPHMRDMVDGVLEITRENNRSRIQCN